MTLTNKLRTELASTAAGPRLILLEDQGRRLTCDLAAADRLGCQVNRLSVASGVLAGATIDDLKQVADQLAGRLTYLLEAIGPVELDHDQCVVQMRSNPPQKDDDGTAYYELLVKEGGELSLRRYQKAPGQPRQAIPATLTQEVLVRLVHDFCAVLDEI